MLKHDFKMRLRQLSCSFIILFFFVLIACNNERNPDIIVIGFLDAVEDATLALSRDGFVQALSDKGWSEEAGNLKIIFRNAQGDMTTLTQSLDFFIVQNVDLIAANSTLSTISAVQRTENIPVCMMVAPEPHKAGITDIVGNPPEKLFGVYETLDYIDSSVLMIQEWLPEAKRIGVVYNQAETQSINALKRIEVVAKKSGMKVISLPVTSSSESQLVVQSLLFQNIDVFFAMPDNIIFSTFEVIYQSCNDADVPIFTSEAGLVSRGAVAAYGADFYAWGYQAGLQAVAYFDSGKKEIPALEVVQKRNRVFNPSSAKRFNFSVSEEFEALKL